MAQNVALAATLPARQLHAVVGRAFTFVRPHNRVPGGVPMTATFRWAEHATFAPGVAAEVHGEDDGRSFATALFLPYGTVLTPADGGGRD